MISRRVFLPALAGSLASRRWLPAQPSVCVGGLYDYRDLEATVLRSRRTFRFSANADLERPRWWKLSPDDQKKLAAKIQSAYTGLIQRSLRNPRDLGGLIGQAWIHHNACEKGNIHRNSAFLPWHRAFLFFHERWLQKELRDRTFRLPAWDWETNPVMPPIFDGWLKIPKYDGTYLDCNYLGNTAAQPINQATLRSWLLSHCFIDFTGGRAGTSLSVPNAFWGPHNNVHTQLCGLMKDTRASALHPIFYMHHANVDRYWAAWWEDYKKYDGFDPEWVKGPMYFADPEHHIVRVYPEQVQELSGLGYHYTRPDDQYFQYTNICAVPDKNVVSLNPNAFLQVFRTMARLKGSPLSTVGPYFPPHPIPELLQLLQILLNVLPDFAFPVRMKLQIPGMEAGVSYPLFLDSARIGSVSYFGSSHHMPESVVACAALRLADMGSMFQRMLRGLPVSLGNSGSPAVGVMDFEILIPPLDDSNPDLAKLLGI